MSNAIDDETRIERGISTDSPASSRKVFLTCKALNQTDVRSVVLSIGRGKTDGSKRYFPSKVKRFQGILIIYAPFLHVSFLSELISFFWPITLIFRFRRNKQKNVFLFWNRTLAYIPTLIIAHILNMRTVLDLEDGNILSESPFMHSLGIRLKTKIYDSIVSRALITCTALKEDLKIKQVMCYYGTVESTGHLINFNSSSNTSILLCGTVSVDTGAPLVIEAVEKLRERKESWAQNVKFVVTGKGDCIERMRILSSSQVFPQVTVHGRTSDNEYRKILASCQVGLALKPKSGMLANTTFPSKVIEMANEGLLVLTTDISDVKLVLGEGALYTNSTVDQFIDRIRWIVENRLDAQKVAQVGNINVWEKCSPRQAGERLGDFLFN